MYLIFSEPKTEINKVNDNDEDNSNDNKGQDYWMPGSAKPNICPKLYLPVEFIEVVEFYSFGTERLCSK